MRSSGQSVKNVSTVEEVSGAIFTAASEDEGSTTKTVDDDVHVNPNSERGVERHPLL